MNKFLYYFIQPIQRTKALSSVSSVGTLSSIVWYRLTLKSYLLAKAITITSCKSQYQIEADKTTAKLQTNRLTCQLAMSEWENATRGLVRYSISKIVINKSVATECQSPICLTYIPLNNMVVIDTSDSYFPY